jgi:hexulose-6-phosphate isomerase
MAADSASKRGALKKALCFGMVSAKLPLEDKFKMVKDCGFDGVEVGTVNDEKQVEATRAAAEKAGVCIHSIMNSGGWSSPLASPDPAVVEKGLNCMKTSLRNAKAFGADGVLLVPAGSVKPPMTREEAYERSQRNIKTLLALAQELGVVIAIENVWDNFILDPKMHVRYVDDFASPFVKAYFDVGNAVKFAPPQDWIRALGPRIKKIHLKDFDPKQKSPWVPLLEGTVNWREVRRALDEIGYEGYLTAELKGGDEAYLRDVSARIDKTIAGA